jgi:hypothetical protein
MTLVFVHLCMGDRHFFCNGKKVLKIILMSPGTCMEGSNLGYARMPTDKGVLTSVNLSRLKLPIAS